MTGVMLAMPTTRDFPPETVMSLLSTQRLCDERGINLTPCMVQNVSLGAFAARNLAAHVFLEETDCSHIFWIDSDIVWLADDFLYLLALGLEYPFIAGVYPIKQDKPKFAFYTKGKKNTKADNRGVLKLDGVGLGFTCVQRKVMKELAARSIAAKCHQRKENIRQIFRNVVIDGELIGEDIQFCKDVQALGYETNIYPHIVLGHIGPKIYQHGTIAEHWQRL